MKLLIVKCLIILCGTLAVHSQANWFVHNAQSKGDLVAVYFTSSNKGWIAGDNGFLASTADGGKTWSKYPLNATEDINEIYFRNDDNGYLVAGKKLFLTNDAGRTWQETRIWRTEDFAGGVPEFLSIRFSDKKHGYAIGSILRRNGREDEVADSLVMRTDNGGESWSRIVVPSKTELFHLVFHGNSHGWIVGDKGLILETRDSGLTWHEQTSGVTRALFNIDFRDDDEGYAVGGGGTILRTENGGQTWEKVKTDFTETLKRVDFADDKNGWIVGYGGTILRSSDKGKTWSRQESNTKAKLYGLYMQKKYGWAVGADGIMLEFQK